MNERHLRDWRKENLVRITPQKSGEGRKMR